VQLENHFTVAAPIDEAWKVLLDVERVAHCMPGATLDSVDGDEFNGKVKVKVGPIVVTYQGVARFVERDEAAHRAVIDASGKESRGSGTAKATVTTALVANGGQTDVSVVTDLNITGRPAQFGRGVIADVATKLTDKFAESLAAELAGSGGAADAKTAAAGSTNGPASGAGAQPDDGTRSAASSGGSPSGSTSASSPPADPTIRAAAPTSSGDDDVIDLLGVSTMPILKRLAPVLAAIGVLGLLAALRRRRARRG
jgi:carbon monoxide dehydrogenase subunit G